MTERPQHHLSSSNEEIWQNPFVVQWTQRLLDSFQHWTNRELTERQGSLIDQARSLFEAPFVLVSHGLQEDPILNYGNRSALELWEMNWEQLTTTPSRMTTEFINQSERAQMLHRAAQNGFIDDYSGIRISRTGRRFLVEHATVWNVIDGDLQKLGQAAIFSDWTYLP